MSRSDGIIYLASPYSHPDIQVREYRYQRVIEVAQRLTLYGYIIFSPIIHSHPLATNEQIATDWTFWERIDTAFVQVSSELWVVKMDGWEQSKGIAAEVKIAQELCLPIKYIDA